MTPTQDGQATPTANGMPSPERKGPTVLAFEESFDESGGKNVSLAAQEAKASMTSTNGALTSSETTESQPSASLERKGPTVLAFEDSSGESGRKASETERTTSVDSTGPGVVITEDDSSKKAEKMVSFKHHAKEHVMDSFKSDLEEEGKDMVDDEIPGPATLPKHPVIHSELDLSGTEHHRKGGGILASQRELRMSMSEFAAGCNLLQTAARGDREAMEMLLAANPRHVDFRDYDRRTALHVAASEGHLDICKYLVEEKNARINRSDRWGGSPLDDAHRHRQDEVVAFLRKHGATTGSLDQGTNLITAAAEGDAEEVALLLSLNYSVINQGDYDKRTALHLAAGEGRLDVVKLLVKAGADVNAEDRWGGRPLDDAKRNRHDDVCEYLVKMGADDGETHEREETVRKDPSLDDDNMRIEFGELEMIERIGAGAFGEIYKCRWRGTLVAAKCIKSAKIRREWLVNHAMASVRDRGGDVDDAMRLMDEADLSQSEKDEAIADFRQEIKVLRSLRYGPSW